MKNLSEYSLRPMKEADLPLVLKWRNSEHVRAHMFTDHQISEEEHYDWFERNRDRASLHVFVQSEKLLGVVNVTDIDKQSGRASWGFYLGEKNLPKGTGFVMGYLALNFIFDELEIRKLCSEILISNKISLKFHKKLGFGKEGRFYDHVFKNNAYQDVIFMALFAQDWRKHREKIKKLL